MRSLRLLSLVIVAAAAMTLRAAAPDSLERAVAVFFSSQFKLALANGLADLRATGLDVDSAAVTHLIAAEMAQPYDAAAQDAAFATIDAAANAVVVNESRAMLSRAAEMPGAEVLPSGVVINTLSSGVGSVLKTTDTVTMRYTGRLPDGTVFDAIEETDEPLSSPVNQFVSGMTEGLAHMRRGGHYILTIPADRAYGVHGVQGVIPPNSALQFDITILD